MWDGHLGWIYFAKHWIELVGETVEPVQSTPRASVLSTREFELVEFVNIATQKVITPSHTKWASLKAFTTEKDGILCLLVDHRRRDALVKWESYPISWIYKWSSFIEYAGVINTLGANSGYRKVIIDERDRDRELYCHTTDFIYSSRRSLNLGMPAALFRAQRT